MFVLFFVNIVFIVLMTNLDAEADIEQVTPEDFTLFISDIPKDIGNYEEIRTNFLSVNDITPIEVNPAYNINEFNILKEKFINLKKKLRYMHIHKLEEYKFGCFGPIEKKEDIAREIMNVDIELNNILASFNKEETNMQLFTGYVFATFKDIDEYENYTKLFPSTFFDTILLKLNYYFCFCCHNEKKRAWMRQALEMNVQKAHEPNDIKWENLYISPSNRFWRTIIIYLTTILILAVSFGVLVGVSVGQKKIKVDNKTLLNIISVIFACITSIFNFIVNKSMIALTIYEKNTSQTNYLLSLSLKILVFTFLNSAVIPVVVFFITNDNFGNNSSMKLLVNNTFFIFILNSITSPIIYLINPFNILNYFLRKNIIKKIENDPDYYIDKTQGELNKIFEYTDIELAVKYAYIGKTLAMVVFYLPILPLGAPISFFGLVLLYAVEKFNVLYFYKRPERINGEITLSYVKLFKWFIFLYAISNYIFIGDIYKYDKSNQTRYELIAIIVFGCLTIVPVERIFNCIPCLNLTNVNNDNYYDMYFEIGMTYEMANPITKNKGFERYLDKMKENNIVDDNDYYKLRDKIVSDPSDIIEFYYNKKFCKDKQNMVKPKTGFFKGLLKKKDDIGIKSKTNNTYVKSLQMFKHGVKNLVQHEQHEDKGLVKENNNEDITKERLKSPIPNQVIIEQTKDENKFHYD